MLEGKFAVVTCGDTEIGAAIIRLFAEHGVTIAFAAKDTQKASNLLSTIIGISPDSFYQRCDLVIADQIEAFCAEVNRRKPLVDVLVNNPWLEFDKAFDASDEDDDELLLQVYQRSIMQTLRAFWPAMFKAGGCSVVNISSDSVFKSVQGSLMQTMAFGAIGGMTRVPAVEGGYREVRVNEILAGSSAVSVYWNPTTGQSPAATASNTAISTANTALFLASEMASYISGVSLSVGGGKRRMR